MDFSDIPALDGEDGRLIQTANQMGFMSAGTPDEYTAAFIEFSAATTGPVADLGCAYGYKAKLMLDAGAKRVIANDLHPGHLDFFHRALTEDERNRVDLRPGDAIQVCSAMAADSMAGILACNWLHFLTGEEIRNAFHCFYRALKPDGMLVVTTVSLRCGVLSEPSREKVEKCRLAGDEWPGWLPNAPLAHGLCDALPTFHMYLDPDQLTREAELAGFRVVKASYFARLDMPAHFRMDGREGAGLIALKPRLLAD